eukprot:CAMPEP_0172561452 /NCGR_PEP_ID=MMETSP1067-20121228/92958_1 /TAXON_ID=265564 ORGANISM="Thalassiosira punctigera, Strain Tpunct2005C2" /NCGR_SAMPLE_ID=MMETSP1067 /ASSEMBLY_ACC=CAM_ASM_000444 /LENGTH=43 /DNA_ID= /DNA_START= /DNA_END= /DNA_ORIENTATION=
MGQNLHFFNSLPHPSSFCRRGDIPQDTLAANVRMANIVTDGSY